jgi:diacylglycerol kinase (ATP)
MKNPFEFTGRIRSFRYAGRGVWLTLKSQHNAWIHAAATIIVLIAGYLLGISRQEWCLIILACAAVWTAEALNTAIEHLADATTNGFHPLIGQAKDVAAGAVLITATAAIVVGVLVFGPYLLVFARTVHP